MPERQTGQLAEIEARFQATFEQAAVGIAHVAPDGGWLRVNQRLCDIVGYSRDELMRMTFQDITHPEDLEKDMAQVNAVLSGKLPNYAMEKRYFRKDGGIVWINLTVSLIWQAPGIPDYFISVIEDISQRKAAEIEVENLRKSLVDIQEAERQFLALELHDEVGQRLSAIKIALVVAQKKCTDSAVLELLEQADQISASLIWTIKDMAQKLRPSQLDDFGVKAAIESLLEQIGDQLELAIELEESIGDRRFHRDVELAAYRITQEALSNILRHAHCAKVRIVLSAEHNNLELRIEDDGLGFNQARPGQENALGLIGMRERTHALGGKFTVDSKMGRGTLVAATLPIKQA